MGADADGSGATFRLCWDERSLYLLAEVADATPMQNSHRGDSIWSGDAIELFIGHERLDQPGTLLFTDRQVLLSGALVDGAPQSYLVHVPQLSLACRRVRAVSPCQSSAKPSGGELGSGRADANVEKQE